MEGVVHFDRVTFSYDNRRDVIKDLSFSVERGEFVAFLGANGSGKSTLLKLVDGIYPPDSGRLTVLGYDTADKKSVVEIRKRVGIVSQNPESLFVRDRVDEEVGFSLTNYISDEFEIGERVSRALESVGLAGYEGRAINTLSGGEKQRLALASVLVMEPELLIFDEVLSMLDGESRRELLSLLLRLRSERRVTILFITHYAEEAAYADRVIILKDGRILADGESRSVLTEVESLERASLFPPCVARIALRLQREGLFLRFIPVRAGEFREALWR